MSAPIGPGDYVECVDNSPHRSNSQQAAQALRQLVVGRIYRVRAITPKSSVSQFDILLDGLVQPHEAEGFGWALYRFRPIYRRSDKILKSVLLPVDEEAHA